MKKVYVYLVLLSLFSMLQAGAAGTHGEGAASGKAVQRPLEARFLGVVDGHVLVDAGFGNGDGSLQRMTASDGLTWQVVQGNTGILEDPFTGETLFKAQGLNPVVVRPSIGGTAGSDLTVGIDTSILPNGESTFLLAGGGACAANPNHAHLFALVVDVRAIIDTHVIPISLDERLLIYRNSKYYAFDPMAGPMRLSYTPGKVSFTRLNSLSPPTAPGNPFFPAAAETQLYLSVDFLASGMRIENRDPMVLRSDSIEWLPFETPQTNSDPVDFYDVDNPNNLVMQIVSQEQYVYPTREIRVDSSSFSVNSDGALVATFTLINESESEADLRWFVLGDIGAAQSPVEGLVELVPGGTETVQIRSTVKRALYTQAITLGVVSQGGPRLTGLQKQEFHYPADDSRRSLLGSQ